jgi:uncharacterized protein involved in exopolysaccharide biosynthesis
MAPSEPRAQSVKNIIAIAKRHRKTIILCPIVSLLFGAAVFVFCPRTYRSESRNFIRVGRESVGLDPTATTGQTVALQQSDRKDEIKSAMEILKSRTIVAKAVDRVGPEVVLGIDKDDNSGGFRIGSIVSAPVRLVGSWIKRIDPVSVREQAIVEAERHLYVMAERESTLIVVQYDADSPKLAQTVCDAVVAAYRNEHMRVYRNDESRPFFEEQRQRLREQLDSALAAVRDVKNEIGLSTVEQRSLSLEAQFNAVELDRLETEQELATAEARIARLELQLSEVPERLVESKKAFRTRAPTCCGNSYTHCR